MSPASTSASTAASPCSTAAEEVTTGLMAGQARVSDSTDEGARARRPGPEPKLDQGRVAIEDAITSSPG
jgi:hypothetical protein